jgi:protein tyrosine/serine phosphatase
MSTVEGPIPEAPSDLTQYAPRTVARKLFWLRRLIAALVVAIAISYVWSAYTKNHFYPVNFGVVEPGFYRSGQLSRAVVRDVLQRNHIEVIVNLCPPDPKDGNIAAEEKAAAELGIDRRSFPLRGDGRGDPNMYVKAVQTIIEARKAGKPVLVHCAAGEQRTSGVIAAYQVIIEGKSEEEAFQQARKYLYDPKHNPYLRPYFDSHLAEWRAALTPPEQASAR